VAVTCTGVSEKALCKTLATLCSPQLASYSYFAIPYSTYFSFSHSLFPLFFRDAVFYRENGCSRFLETLVSPTKLHGITYHRNVIFMFTATKASSGMQMTNLSITSTLRTYNVEGGRWGGVEWFDNLLYGHPVLHGAQSLL
jgi:hypothetical protein